MRGSERRRRERFNQTHERPKVASRRQSSRGLRSRPRSHERPKIASTTIRGLPASRRRATQAGRGIHPPKVAGYTSIEACFDASRASAKRERGEACEAGRTQPSTKIACDFGRTSAWRSQARVRPRALRAAAASAEGASVPLNKGEAERRRRESEAKPRVPSRYLNLTARDLWERAATRPQRAIASGEETEEQSALSSLARPQAREPRFRRKAKPGKRMPGPKDRTQNSEGILGRQNSEGILAQNRAKMARFWPAKNRRFLAALCSLFSKKKGNCQNLRF